jgi:DNA-binding NarL/FixJ family response regulator
MNPWNLTERQCEIMDRLATNGCNKQTARELGIQLRTLEVHLITTYRRMQVKNRVLAVAKWVLWRAEQERKAA